MLLDRHHDQHRRQEEDGDDSAASLPPARYAGTKKRRIARGGKFGEEELYGEEGDYADGDEDGEEYEVEDVDDDLAPVDDGTSKFSFPLQFILCVRFLFISFYMLWRNFLHWQCY